MVKQIGILILFLALSIPGFSQKKEIYRDTEVHGSLTVEDSLDTPYAVVDSFKLAGSVINEIIRGNNKLETDTMVIGISRLIDYHVLDVLDSIVVYNNVTGARLKKLYP
ncbi:MAG: hypothetical protein JXQ80_12220 [Bacteroidales bacterium]|nr:hypothetical protein [Bacteroidales bacterium]